MPGIQLRYIVWMVTKIEIPEFKFKFYEIKF